MTSGSGNITRRGNSWRIKFDLPRSQSGDRRTQYVTVRGTKKDAQRALTRRLNEVEEGTFVERSSVTLSDYAQHWLFAIAPAGASAKTLERYREIVETTITPRLGGIPLQRLDAPSIDSFYAYLGTSGRRDGKGGLSPQTVVHTHRLLSLILKSAVIAGKLRSSPMLKVQTTPKVRQREIQVLNDEQLTVLLRHLRGQPLYMPVVTAAGTGMRRGEILALRWQDIDFDRKTLRVAQVVEKTRESIALKEPKTERSRRTIALPSSLVQALQRHRSEQASWRLRLGLGKCQNDLVFPAWNGELQNPDYFTKAFSREIAATGLPAVTFHGLRHTHISHLLKSGVPVNVVAARAGHANPNVTLAIYAHLLPGQQEGAAAVIDATLKTALED